jgi:thiamine-monophosphate kinase
LTAETRRSFLNEEEIIKLIWKVLSPHKPKKRKTTGDPFSDDVSWFPNSRKKLFVVAKTDMLVSDTDSPRQMTPSQISSKAIVAVVSDFAAKAVRPSFFMVSIAIPRRKSTYDYVLSLAKGIDRACKKYRLKLLSGDTSGSKGGIVIDVSAFGFSDKIVKRNTAKAGEIIGVTGRFGLTSSGLLMLLRNIKSKDKLFQRRAKRSVLQPEAKLSQGLRIGSYLTSSIDSSDGLALSLYRIAEASNVDMNLDSLPMAQGVKAFAKQNGLSEEDLVLFGGEEYELVVTFREKYAKILKRFGVITIGRTSKVKTEKPGVYLRSKLIPRRGWLHNR